MELWNKSEEPKKEGPAREEREFQIMISQIRDIIQNNFKDFIGLGLKTTALVVLDYKANLSRIRELLCEYRYSFMHYERYPTMILKIRMILDFFQKMKVIQGSKRVEEKASKTKEKENRAFDMKRVKKRVIHKINDLLQEYGQTQKTFIDKHFDKITGRANTQNIGRLSLIYALFGSKRVEFSSENDIQSRTSRQTSRTSSSVLKSKARQVRQEYSSYYRDFNSIMFVKKYSFRKLRGVLARLESLKNNMCALFQMSQFVETVKMNSGLVPALAPSHWARLVRNPEIFWLNANQ